MKKLTDKQKEILLQYSTNVLTIQNNIFYLNGKPLTNVENKPYKTLIKNNCLIINEKGWVLLNREHPIVKELYIKTYNKVPEGLVLKDLSQEKMYDYYLKTYVDSETFNKEQELNKFTYFNFNYINLKNTDIRYLCLFHNNKLIGYISYSWLRRVGFYLENNKGRLYCLESIDIHEDYKGNNLSKVLLSNLNKYIPNNEFIYTQVSSEGNDRNVEKNIKLLIKVPTIEYYKIDVSKYKQIII